MDILTDSSPKKHAKKQRFVTSLPGFPGGGVPRSLPSGYSALKHALHHTVPTYASLALADYSQVGTLGVQYKSVNFGVEENVERNPDGDVHRPTD
jgi:hypothetical protein